MTVRVAINGFGRIGRLVLRSALEHNRSDIRVVAINDLGPVETNAHLLKYDTVHGNLPQDVKVDGDTIDAGQGPIRVTAERDPANLPHRDLDIDVVLECTGIFTDGDKAKAHIDAGAKRVVISAPAKNVSKTVVYGVNHDAITADDLIISNASCTTNCLAPVAKVLNDAIGIERGYMTTVHSYTGDQPTLDRLHKDLYRARAAAAAIIPTSTGAAKAVGLVLPELAGKLDGAAVRVPTPNVSMIDLTFDAAQDTTPEAINQALIAAADGPLHGVLGYTNEPLVSADFNHDNRSSIVALPLTQVVDGKFARVLSWYDNEWGFSTRMLDTAAALAARIPTHA